MFTPTNSIESNQIKTLARDVVMIKGTINKGSKVRIVGYSKRGYDIVDLESGIVATEVSDIFGKVFDD